MLHNKILRLSLSSYDKYDLNNVLDFLIENKINMQELINNVSIILDWREISDIERECLNEFYDYLYQINYK
jgi:threonine dehydrogenase-like Zn-dependent dehydrogenase